MRASYAEVYSGEKPSGFFDLVGTWRSHVKEELVFVYTVDYYDCAVQALVLGNSQAPSVRINKK